MIAKKWISYSNPILTILKKWLTRTIDAWISLLIKTSSSLHQFREQIKLMFHLNIRETIIDDLVHEFKYMPDL